MYSYCRQGQLFSDFKSSNFQTNFILFDSISCWAAWFPLFVAFCHIHLVLMTFTSQMAPKRIRQSLPVTDLTLYLTLLCPCMLRFEIIKYYILYCKKKKCIEEFPVCSGHTLPLSYVLRETKSLDRVPLGSLQKCGNITTPAWLFVAQSPCFLFLTSYLFCWFVVSFLSIYLVQNHQRVQGSQSQKHALVLLVSR